MTDSPPRRWARRALAALFIADAGLHVFLTEALVTITPPWVPFPRTVVLATGAAALAGGVGLFIPATRRWAGIALALYSACVFPANLYHALEGVRIDDVKLGWLYHGPRLVLQPVIVWWCLWASSVIDWPFRKSLPPPA